MLVRSIRRLSSLSNSLRFCHVDANPEAKVKVGRLEKVVQYFKNILDDYRMVAVEIAEDMKARPIKSSIYLSLIGTGFYFTKHNPSEAAFDQQLVDYNNELLLLGDDIRNPRADNHMQTVTRWQNQGRLRRFTFVVFSVMWLDNYDRGADVYEARAPSLKVGWLEMPSRVVDVGALGRWWWLNDAMLDYDVNFEEWGEPAPVRRWHLPDVS